MVDDPSRRDAPLRFGYRWGDVVRIADHVAATRSWGMGRLEPWERFDLACSAIAAHLYVAECAPSPAELFDLGCREVHAEVGQRDQMYGTRRGFEWGRRRSFERYWSVARSPYPSPEQRVVEVVTLGQIWALLSPQQQRLIVALARWEDYGRAATEMGYAYDSYRERLAQARRVFRRWWHEGEAPSRMWAVERREAGSESFSRILRQRRRRRGDPVISRHRDLSFLDAAELYRRFCAGESLVQIARSYNISDDTVARRIAPYRANDNTDNDASTTPQPPNDPPIDTTPTNDPSAETAPADAASRRGRADE